MVHLESTCSLRSMIEALTDRSTFDDVVIHCSDGQTRTSGVLLAAANEFWSEALLGCCPSGETMVEDFQVYLLDESVEEVEAYTTMLWSGRPPEGFVGRVVTAGERRSRKKAAEDEIRLKVGDGSAVNGNSSGGVKGGGSNGKVGKSRKRRRKERYERDEGVTEDEDPDYEPVRVAVKLEPQDVAFPGFEEDYFAGGGGGVVGHVSDEEEDDGLPGWNLKPQKTRTSGMQQPFLPLAGGLPHPAFLEKPQKVKKKRKKRVIYPEEVDTVAKDEESENVGATKPEDSKPSEGKPDTGDGLEPTEAKETYGEILDNFKRSGDLLLLAMDRKTASAQVVLSPSTFGDLHEACHFLVNLGQLDLLRVLKQVNTVEKPSENKTIESTHSFFDNVECLVRDANDLDHLEKEVYDICTEFARSTQPFYKPVRQMPNCQEGSGPSGLPALKRSDQAILSNSANILELGHTINIVPMLVEVTTLVLVTKARAPGTFEVTDCLKVAEKDTLMGTDELHWFPDCPPEDAVGYILKAMFPATPVSESLTRACPLLQNHMTKLKAEMEGAYRKVRAKGQHLKPCPGCKLELPTLTIAQKILIAEHQNNCNEIVATKPTKNNTMDEYREHFKEVIDFNDEPSQTIKGKAKLEDWQLLVEDQFVKLELPTTDYLFAVSESKCMLVLVEGEKNVGMVHGAAHIMSAFMNIDHRRIFNKITYDSYKHLRSRYFNVEYKERHQILSNYSGHPQMQKNVYQKIRKMADSGQPLDFPPVESRFCLRRDNQNDSELQVSKDFNYLPYTIESTSVAFKGENFLLSLAYEKDIQKLGQVSKFVICNWDPMSCSMTVAQSFDTKLAKKKGKSLLDRDKFTYNGTDTEDFEVVNSERQAAVDNIVTTLHAMVKDPVTIKYAVEDWCPYIQSNLEDAYRHYSIHACKNIDKKEICQCGLIFPSFTLLELNVYRQHVERYHGKKMETGFLCPSPGCNNWAVSEESLVTHIANYHKVSEYCDKCGKGFSFYLFKDHRKKCGQNFHCKICDKVIPKMNLSKHLKRHQQTKEQASCTICGRVVLKERLRLHMNTHLPDHEKKHVCPLCGKGFTTMKDIKKHMNSKTLHRS